MQNVAVEKAINIGAQSTIRCRQVGGVFCKRYEGTFTSTALQCKADTGLWYTGIQGNPFSQTGEGRTPQLAVADAIKRNNELIKHLQNANNTLKDANFAN